MRTRVGVLGGAAPVEVIRAAGAVPVRLRGDPSLPLDEADAWMEPVHDGWLRSIFARLLAGQFDDLDLILVPRSSEGLLQFYYLAEHVRSRIEGPRFPPLHLLDLLQSPGASTALYVRQRMQALVARLGDLTGRLPGERDLREAISRYNRARALFADIVARRRSAPAGISGLAALRLAAAGQVLPVDAFEALLRAELEREGEAQPPAARVMVKGSPQEREDFYALVEASGGVIVADDHDWGERLYDHLVDETAAPLDALVAHYQRHAIGPRLLPQAEQDERLLAAVAAAQVEGVIFWIEENDDTYGWDYPAQKRRLDAAGVPSLLLTGQSYFRPPDPATTGAVARFIGGLARGTG